MYRNSLTQMSYICKHILQELWTFERTTTPHWWRPWKQ